MKRYVWNLISIVRAILVAVIQSLLERVAENSTDGKIVDMIYKRCFGIQTGYIYRSDVEHCPTKLR